MSEDTFDLTPEQERIQDEKWTSPEGIRVSKPLPPHDEEIVSQVYRLARAMTVETAEATMAEIERLVDGLSEASVDPWRESCLIRAADELEAVLALAPPPQPESE